MKWICILFLFCAAHLAAKNSANDPCSAPESNQFDFWIGDWDLTYNDTVHARNHITRELGNCVIYEHFDDPSTVFKGWSWSVYNPKYKSWQQTWVDNQGGYIVLNGKFENGKMILTTDPRPDATGKPVRHQMIFYNISDASFDWNWESTSDEGKNWQVQWKIHYSRHH